METSGRHSHVCSPVTAHSPDTLELVSHIYKAVADASYWQVFLDSLVRVLNATRAALTLRDINSLGFDAVCWSGWPDDDIRLYVERYAAIDPWGAAGRHWPEGEVGMDTEVSPRHHMEASAAFREFYGPRDCIHGIGGTILVTPAGQSLIAAVRGANGGPFGDSEKSILQMLMPHLKHAAILHGEFSAMRRQLATFTAHLDKYPHALLLADSKCRVLYSNAAAREIASERDGLSAEGGRVSLMSRQADAAFRQAVSTVASDPNTGIVRLAGPRCSQKLPFRLMVLRAGDSNAIPLGISQPAVAIVIIDTESQPKLNLSLLREVFSLTPAESRVVGGLVMGRTVEEIASDARISADTVRTHVKRVLSKTSTRRQAELISLVLRTIPFCE